MPSMFTIKIIMLIHSINESGEKGEEVVLRKVNSLILRSSRKSRETQDEFLVH